MAYKILVVDDSKDNRFLIRTCLAAEGYEVSELASGEDLVKLGKDVASFDLILLDVRMPNLNGYEACKILKSSKPGSQVPVIFLSAETDEESRVSGFEAGGVDYIPKPFGRKELGMRIKSHLALSRSFKAVKKEMDLLAANLHEGADIQNSFLPKKLFTHPKVSIDWEYLPVEHVAGDMFGFIPFDNQMLGVYLLDVCGHGSSAALVASAVHGAISSNKALIGQMVDDHLLPMSPSKVIKNLGREFPFERFERYFTFLYLLFDPQNAKIICSTSGHPAPYIIKNDGREPYQMDVVGGILGLDPSDQWQDSEISLEVGDNVLLLSDGVLEAKNKINQTFKGKVLSSLEGVGDYEPRGIVRKVASDLFDHSLTVNRMDDQSIICLKYTS